MRHSINGICMVLFTLVSGATTQVNMTAQEFAHLVSDFRKKQASVFKEKYEYKNGLDNIEYSGFGLLARNDHGRHRNFTLQFSVN